MNNEFKQISKGDITRYVLESGSSGGTSSGSVASVSMPIGGTRKRGANLIAQEADKKTVPATTPRNFVAKNAKSSGAGAHKDKKKAAKQGQEKHKKPFMENRDHPDHEIQMASSELMSIAKNAESLLDMVRRYSEQEGLDAWQQSKITKAADYLNSVLQSINGEQQGVEENMSRRGFLKGAGAMAAGITAASGAHADEKSDPNKLTASMLMGGEFKEFDLTPFIEKNNWVGSPKQVINQAEKWLSDFLRKRGNMYSNLKIKYKGLTMTSSKIGDVDASDPEFESVMKESEQDIAEGDTYFESLQSMVERQLEPNMDLDTWIDNFQHADPNKYHQFKNKTPEKKK